MTVVNESACMFCGDCEAFNTSYADKIVTISQQPNVFKFVVEGTGALPPLEILKKALKVLEVGDGRACEVDEAESDQARHPGYHAVDGVDCLLEPTRQWLALELISSNHCVNASERISGRLCTDCTTK